MDDSNKFLKSLKDEGVKSDPIFDTIYHDRGNVSEFLNNICTGADKTYELKSSDGEVCEFRMVTVHEEMLINSFVENLYSKFPHTKDLDKEFTIMNKSYYRIAITLMIATCPKMPATATLPDYNSCAKIKLADLLNDSSAKMNFLFKNYNSLYISVNPKLENIPKEEMEGLIEAIKKSDFPLSDLDYSTLLEVSTFLVNESIHTDNLLSEYFLKQQS